MTILQMSVCDIHHHIWHTWCCIKAMSLVSSPVLDPKNAEKAPRQDRVQNLEQINLIDQLLKEQNEISAVERFSQKHESEQGHMQRSYYEDLIPIKKPSTGEQYSFEVDLDKCTGCKACVVACHSMNGLHENESWRDIGSIRGLSDGVEELQTVTSACHHCADPGCLNGCPVGAYEKEKDTGIVRHLDDQCIGCQYCSLKCPYDVPKYDKSLGIVRKCDMCHDRLAEGEAPACVQACPNGAIKIKLTKTATIHADAKGGRSILPGAFRSDYTKPSTTFRSSRNLTQDLEASDERELTPAHAHTPLVWMLTLTQVAVGLSLAELAGKVFNATWMDSLHLPLAIAAIIIGNAGLISSFLHLGSPLGAWRIFLGLKTSWLSREIVMFSAWMPALITYTATLILPQFLPQFFTWLPSWAPIALLSSTVVLGLLSVYCSIMVYVDTQRAFWSMTKTLGRFIGTAVISGFAGLLLMEMIIHNSTSGIALGGFLLGCGIKIFTEVNLLTPARSKEWGFAKKSALLQLHPLRKVLTTRWATLSFALLAGLLAIIIPSVNIVLGSLALLALIVGEWMERRLFFQAVVTLKMPGEIAAPTHD